MIGLASMKALPKRKGNLSPSVAGHPLRRLNESPSEKEGKCLTADTPKLRYPVASMKALPKRKGNAHRPDRTLSEARLASMKALPKRKGNVTSRHHTVQGFAASMKALQKRKGNTDDLN